MKGVEEEWKLSGETILFEENFPVFLLHLSFILWKIFSPTSAKIPPAFPQGKSINRRITTPKWSWVGDGGRTRFSVSPSSSRPSSFQPQIYSQITACSTHIFSIRHSISLRLHTPYHLDEFFMLVRWYRALRSKFLSRMLIFSVANVLVQSTRAVV